MPIRGEINSDKLFVKDIFSQYWFRIPEYQRPYVWGEDEVYELLDDIYYALSEKPDSEYFLGSFVFQTRSAAPNKGQEFDENDLLDGQQRLATVLILFAVIRDLINDTQAKEVCQKCIFQEASPYTNVPERTRLLFVIREAVQDFLNSFIKQTGGTDRVEQIKELASNSDDLSVKNMAQAVIRIRRYFEDNSGASLEKYLIFLLNRVRMIYVSTADLDDAFRLFTILNDRGIPLRNSDILKSMNLGAIPQEERKVKFAKLWEEAEGELGDDFERFLNYLRMILVKEKARLSLLQEYNDKIYEPKEKDRTTGQPKQPLLQKGEETFEIVERYLGHYRSIKGGDNFDRTGSYEFDNLVKVMSQGLPSTDWIPPLLRYFDKYRYNRIQEFLKKLDRKFSADWILQKTPTDRIEAMNRLIGAIDIAASIDDILSSSEMDFDFKSLMNTVNGLVYGRRFTLYMLLKLDLIFNGNDRPLSIDLLSVEHILPQNPDSDSGWAKDFTEDERNEWTNRLGNLVLITRRKNSSQGRLEYSSKKANYFRKCIDTCPNSLRIMAHYNCWTMAELTENQQIIMRKVAEYYND